MDATTVEQLRQTVNLSDNIARLNLEIAADRAALANKQVILDNLQSSLDSAAVEATTSLVALTGTIDLKAAPVVNTTVGLPV